MRRLALIVICTLFAPACGFKGPLVLPPPEGARPPAAQSPAAQKPAPQDTQAR